MNLGEHIISLSLNFSPIKCNNNKDMVLFITNVLTIHYTWKSNGRVENLSCLLLISCHCFGLSNCEWLAPDAFPVSLLDLTRPLLRSGEYLLRAFRSPCEKGWGWENERLEVSTVLWNPGNLGFLMCVKILCTAWS